MNREAIYMIQHKYQHLGILLDVFPLQNKGNEEAHGVELHISINSINHRAIFFVEKLIGSHERFSIPIGGCSWSCYCF